MYSLRKKISLFLFAINFLLSGCETIPLNYSTPSKYELSFNDTSYVKSNEGYIVFSITGVQMIIIRNNSTGETFRVVNSKGDFVWNKDKIYKLHCLRVIPGEYQVLGARLGDFFGGAAELYSNFGVTPQTAQAFDIYFDVKDGEILYLGSIDINMNYYLRSYQYLTYEIKDRKEDDMKVLYNLYPQAKDRKIATKLFYEKQPGIEKRIQLDSVPQRYYGPGPIP